MHMQNKVKLHLVRPCSLSLSVVVSVMHCYAGDPGSIPGRVETLGSISVNHSPPYQGVKMVPANVLEDSVHWPCRDAGSTCSQHFKVMAHTKVG